ncbi:MAG: PTS sugar transporter subunit IIA [Deltaproteobacteria bacterium]|nr:PTS sugar transporter subunit IIA [Deltaproteobacteria bacterium]
MRLTELLSPARVGIRRAEGNDFDKSKAIGMLAAMFGEHDGVSASEIERVLLEREALQSTGIGEGVAIPHGALPQLREQVAALLIVPDGVEFQAIDDAKVSILFGVIGPKRATGEHLKTLARVSRLLRSKEFRQRLVGASDARSAFDLISGEEAEKKGAT